MDGAFGHIYLLGTLIFIELSMLNLLYLVQMSTSFRIWMINAILNSTNLDFFCYYNYLNV
jgi:hypothetical protein